MAIAKRRRVATGIYVLERGVYELVGDARYRDRLSRP